MKQAVHAAAPVQQRATGALLRLGAPGDRLEQEADAVAARVLRGQHFAGGSLHAAPGHLQRDARSPWSADEGRRRDDEDAPTAAAGTLQRAPAGGHGAPALRAAHSAPPSTASATRSAGPSTTPPPGGSPLLPPALAAGIHRLRGGGTPLPGAVRGLLEPRFGHDFGRVRIHRDSTAQALADRVNARAFTLGRDVVFGAGQYDTTSRAGLHLLAHELTHVVQQGAAPRQGTSHDASQAITPAPGEPTLRRMAWFPNRDTGTAHAPWGDDGPQGRILEAKTDAGSAIEAWRPDDGQTYWCHGYTFGGAGATGGPYSVFGSVVPRVLQEDGWHAIDACMAQPNDILVFYDHENHEAHSGIVRSRELVGSQIDEALSDLQSKWGTGMLATVSWATNARQYGHYTAYSKAPLTGVCAAKGANEI